jgi:hypothetical protein
VRASFKEVERALPAIALETGNKKLLLLSIISKSESGACDINYLKINYIKRESFSNTFFNELGERRKIPDDFNPLLIGSENKMMNAP